VSAYALSPAANFADLIDLWQILRDKTSVNLGF